MFIFAVKFCCVYVTFRFSLFFFLFLSLHLSVLLLGLVTKGGDIFSALIVVRAGPRRHCHTLQRVC